MGYPSYYPPTREFSTVTICGSMRFYDRMIRVAERLTADGEVVIMPFVTVAAADQGDDFKAMLDRMHRQKIDMADRVVVVTDNQAGYIGESTQAEIQYAESLGKLVDIAMEPPCDCDIPAILEAARTDLEARRADRTKP